MSQAKKEILSVKQERLAIAQEEVDHLNDTIANWKSSHVSCEWIILHTKLKYTVIRRII